MSSVFEQLNSVDVSAKVERKKDMNYLPWAWAWAEAKKRYPNATYTVYENESHWCYHTDGKTCWVKTGVTIEGLEHIEYLPVMDFRNQSIPAEKVTSFDVNKSIQRSLTKALARHGLGLYIYAGEDLPENEQEAQQEQIRKKVEVAPKAPKAILCPKCGNPIKASKTKDGNYISADVVLEKYGMCGDCLRKAAKQEQANEPAQG